MNHHTDQRFQREAHDDVRFSVTTRTAGHRMARHCNAQQGMELQSNADCPLATVGFPGRFGPSAGQCKAAQRNASQGIAKHLKATRIGAWQQALFRAALARMHLTAKHIGETQGISLQCKASQSNADRSLATGSFPGRFGPSASQCSEWRRIASNRPATQLNATQSNADCPLATAGFPGRFGSPGRVSSAALSTD